MTTKSKVVSEVNDIVANASLAEGSKNQSALLPVVESSLSPTDYQAVVGLVSDVLAIEDKEVQVDQLETDGGNRLRKILLRGSPDSDKGVVLWSVYRDVHALFVNQYCVKRGKPADDKKASESGRKGFNRFFNKTGLEVPKSDSPDALRKQAEKKKLESIVNINKAIDDAVAIQDFTTANKLKKEKVRRDNEKNKDILDSLIDIKDKITKELKSCADKDLVYQIADLLHVK